VVVAHSQGSVIAAAALRQTAARPPDGDGVSLVTFGSPLRTLYGWAFPAYFSDEVLRELVPPGGEASVRTWHNVYYLTDFVGGAVLTDPGANGVDCERPDPVTCWYIYGQPSPAAGRHSGYWSDPAVWALVDASTCPGGASPSPPPAAPRPSSPAG
jgi:hypothetical protein